VTNTIEEAEKGQQTIPTLRSSVWPTVIEIVEKKKGETMCSHHWWSPKPWEEFSFSRDSCQTPLNSPPLRRLKFFTWDICISLIFLLNCHVELFRKPHHDNHIDSYFECTRQKQSFLEQVFGYLWQRWNFKGNFELSININAGLCVLTIPQEKS